MCLTWNIHERLVIQYTLNARLSTSSAVYVDDCTYSSIGATLEGLKLVSTSRCGCFGEILTYECTVMGSTGGAKFGLEMLSVTVQVMR